jgi:hypothetical protein
MRMRPWLCTVFFAPDGGGGDPPAPNPSPTPPPAPKTFSEEYVRELREENKTWRQKAQGHETAAQEAARKATEATEAATKTVTEAQAKADQRVIDAELRRLADKAGLVDLEGLKLLDTSVVKLDSDGNVVVPEKFFEDAKKAKPWLFATPNSSNTDPTPKPKPGDTKKVTDMSREEWQAARAEQLKKR